jgi:hypothetical protein
LFRLQNDHVPSLTELLVKEVRARLFRHVTNGSATPSSRA